MKKQSIKKILNGKPSVAIQAMIDGLKKQSKRKLFKINMGSYGHVTYDFTSKKEICFGCAATCTVQQIAGKNFTPKKIKDLTFDKEGYPIDVHQDRALFLNFDADELDKFEWAIDTLRSGYVNYLHYFIFGDFNHPDAIFDMLSDNYKFDDLDDSILPILTTDTWEDCIHHYKKLANNYRTIGY